MRYQGFELRLDGDFTPEEARAVVDRVLESSGDRVNFMVPRAGPRGDGPPERAFVKAEFRRPHQQLSRRLRRGRAVAEGRGLRFFRAAGIRVPQLLMFGEQSRARLRACSLVCTQKIRALDAKARYEEAPDRELGRRLAQTLAHAHAHGFVHGDAVLRNFVPTDDAVYLVDLPRWARWDGPGAEGDLARLAGSAVWRGADWEHAEGLLADYGAAPDSPAALLDPGWLERVLEAAHAYVDHLQERDRTRAERRARRRDGLRPGERG